MPFLIITLIFGLGFAFFAGQNNSLVDIQFGNVVLPEVPLHLVILSSILIGVSLAGIYYLIESISTKFTLKKKDKELVVSQKEVAELSKRIHKLEIENNTFHKKTKKKVDKKAL